VSVSTVRDVRLVPGRVPPERVLVDVPVWHLATDNGNPRGTLREIEELAASIVEVGLLEPPLGRVEGGRIVLVTGHRRLAAMKFLHKRRMPVQILRDLSPGDVLLAQLIGDDQRSRLDPVEEAKAIRRLMDTRGYTLDQVAARLGRSRSTISERIALLELDDTTQARVRAGELPLTQAVDAVRSTRRIPGQRRPARTYYFGAQHPQSEPAGQKCRRARHDSHSRLAGGIACGPCWESAIRDDEREHLPRT
jgi:ParB family chromosome partitioning protein